MKGKKKKHGKERRKDKGELKGEEGWRIKEREGRWG